MRSTVLAALVGALVAAGVLLVFDDDDSAPDSSRPAAGTAAPPSAGDVFRSARGAIVRVDARPPGSRIPRGRPTRADGVATGSGFLVDRQGTIVTNEHVVAGGPVVTVRFGPGAGRVRARVLRRDRDTDLAVLRIPARRAGAAAPLPLGSSRAVRVGDLALALGNPFGLERTLTLGIVSAVDREIEAPNGEEIDGVVQTDAAINPGSSGGPLLDARGQVIGVNSQAEADGIGYAVPVDTLKRVLSAARR